MVSRSIHSCVLGYYGPRGCCRKSFVVRCLCCTFLLCPESTSDLLHGLIEVPSLKVFARSMVLFPFACKGRGSKGSGRGTKQCETDLPSQGACCRFSDASKVSRLFPSVLCSFLGLSPSFYCSCLAWRSIDTFSYLVRGWTLFGVTYRTM